MDKNHELIFCIVNTGFSETVMNAAKEVGARGGTVIHARGTANKDAEEFFGITVQPDKEIVMILVPEDIKDAVLHALYKDAGLKTEGQGIAFSMPVSHVVGLSGGETKNRKEDKKHAEKEEKSEDKSEEPTGETEDKK